MKNSLVRKSFLIGLTALLLFTTLACKTVMGTPTPAPIPVSSEAVEELTENIQEASKTAVAGGPIELTITQEQLTSIVVQQMQTSGQEQAIENLQIHLVQDEMQFSGTVKQDNMSVQLFIALKLSVDSQGKLHTEIISAKLGPLPLPQAILDEITSQLDQNMTTQFGWDDAQVQLKEIKIYDGYMTILGEPR